MFIWKESPRGAAARAHDAKAADAMYRRELEDRASLLLRLGRSPAFVKSRLAGNVEWDFDLHPRPSHAADVDKIVDAVVRRHRGPTPPR
jgi:hypothetical protein